LRGFLNFFKENYYYLNPTTIHRQLQHMPVEKLNIFLKVPCWKMEHSIR
jgi:hypothetical protein